MKHIVTALLIFAFFLQSGCSSSQAGTPIEPAVPLPTETRVSPANPTATDTPAPAPTISPAPTVYTSPTATPENLVLADQGYDIADVQLSYPNPGEVQITFQYRIHESERAKSHAIGPLLPSSCTDAHSSDYPHFFMVPRNSVTGQGSYDYIVKSQGGCDLASFYMVIYAPYSSGRWPTPDAIVYREEIDQPIKVVRDLPAMNAKTLTVEHFAFQTTDSWSGVFTFDYSFSPELADIIGKYRFVLKGSGMSGIAPCDLNVAGPLITQAAGTYEIDIDLRSDLAQDINGIDCRNRLDTDASLTYEQIWLSSEDDTYQQYIDFDITFKK
ncbi:MAG TPA: hypothetical protein VHP14_12180 [Anaerolineales bacterium]|nr:hypothetical protein [Anaerolineales bacterium]